MLDTRCLYIMSLDICYRNQELYVLVSRPAVRYLMAKRNYIYMASVKLVGVKVLLNGSMSGFLFLLILTCEVFL